jgi:hypothetical protein
VNAYAQQVESRGAAQVQQRPRVIQHVPSCRHPVDALGNINYWTCG